MNKKTLKEIKELYCNVLSETLSKSGIDKKIIEKVMDLSESGRIVDPDGNDLNLDDDFKIKNKNFIDKVCTFLAEKFMTRDDRKLDFSNVNGNRKLKKLKKEYKKDIIKTCRDHIMKEIDNKNSLFTLLIDTDFARIVTFIDDNELNFYDFVGFLLIRLLSGVKKKEFNASIEKGSRDSMMALVESFLKDNKPIVDATISFIKKELAEEVGADEFLKKINLEKRVDMFF